MHVGLPMEIEDRLRAQGRPIDIRRPVLFAVCAAAGDISYSFSPEHVGIRLDGLGHAPVAAWCQVIERNQVLRQPSHAA